MSLVSFKNNIDLTVSYFFTVLYLYGQVKLLQVYIQGDSLPDQQTLRGDSRHENKHY